MEGLNGFTVKHNELTAGQFIELWSSVWGDPPSYEQTAVAMEHTLFRVSVFDGEMIVAMARMIGDMGLDYYTPLYSNSHNIFTHRRYLP